MKKIDIIYDRVLSGKHFSPCFRSIKRILPNLMTNNIKLFNKLNDKLNVSSFLNDTELRNQKYLRNYVSFSNNYLLQIKSGIDLNKVIKNNIPKITVLNEHINNDCLFKGRNIINKEKKIIIQDTEEETNFKIENLIERLKRTLNPKIKKIKNYQSLKLYKSLSPSQLMKNKNILNYHIGKEEKEIKDHISNYLNNIHKTTTESSKELNTIKKNICLYKRMKFINYKRPKHKIIKDKECPNLYNIKHKLFPKLYKSSSNYFIYNNKENENYVNIFNRNSIMKINDFDISKKINEINNNSKDLSVDNFLNNKNNFIKNKKEIILTDKKDSYTILQRIANNYISKLKLNKKYNIISDLIDIDLPNINEYDKIINKKIKYKTKINNNEYDENLDNKKLQINSFDNIKDNIKDNKLFKELYEIKYEIKKLKNNNNIKHIFFNEFKGLKKNIKYSKKKINLIKNFDLRKNFYSNEIKLNKNKNIENNNEIKNKFIKKNLSYNIDKENFSSNIYDKDNSSILFVTNKSPEISKINDLTRQNLNNLTNKYKKILLK